MATQKHIWVGFLFIGVNVLVFRGRVAFTAICFVALMSVSVFATPQIDEESVGQIVGEVIDAETLQPIGSAQVTVTGTRLGVYCKSDGKFTINKVPTGIRSVIVKAIGYGKQEISDIAVSPGKPVTILVKLDPVGVLADTTLVVADAFRRNEQLVTSMATLNSEEVRRLPGVQEDVVRAIALFPGIAVSQAGRNDIAVRGGAPFENLFLIDNIEVPNINHFGSQGSTGGPLSLINVDLVNDVTLSTGGFGSAYGDKLSSVTNLSLRNGNENAVSGELNLSTTGFSAIGEGPLGTNGSWLLAARRSYLDLIFNLAGFGFIPEYWDFTAKASYSISQNDELSFLTIGALDKVTFNNSEENLYSNSRVVAPSQNQYFTGITWRHLYTDGYVKTTLGRNYSKYNTIQQDSLGSTIFKANTTEGENSLRVDAVWFPSATVEINGGLTGKFASELSYDITLPGYSRLDSVGIASPLVVDTTFTALRGGAYLQAIWKMTESLSVTLGTRFDTYSWFDNNSALSPRLAITYALTPAMTLSAAGGIYNQAPQYIWMVGDVNNSQRLGLSRVYQGVASWQYTPSMDLKFQIEAYYKVYDAYPARLFRPQAVVSSSGFDDVYTDIPFGLEPLSSDATGISYGAELLVQKKLSEEIPLYGLLSISLNHTEFTSIENTARTGTFETPFIFSFSLGWRPNDLWELSGKVRASQGAPTTPFITTEQRAIETGFPVGSLDFMYYNAGQRMPMFFALDLRVDKRWFFAGWQLITYIDVQNVTGRENVAGYQWNQQTAQVDTRTSIGVLPSIGINVEF